MYKIKNTISMSMHMCTSLDDCIYYLLYYALKGVEYSISYNDRLIFNCKDGVISK